MPEKPDQQDQIVHLQQLLIEAQAKIIALQETVQAMTPPRVNEQDVFWHLVSGVMSEQAAASDDLDLVRRFKDWNIRFAQTYLKPYVDPRIYSETLNQMTRGLSSHIAQLQTDRDQHGQGKITKQVKHDD